VSTLDTRAAGRWLAVVAVCAVLVAGCEPAAGTSASGRAGNPTSAAESAGDPAGARGAADDPAGMSGAEATGSPGRADAVAGAAAAGTPGPTGTGAAADGSTARPDATGTGTALAALALIRIKGRAPMTGYSRDQFGPAWKDVDHNGCDTRDDVLARDLVNLVRRDGCVIASGTLNDPYTGSTIHFVRGIATSAKVQIDHVVALGDAWQTGAQGWDATRRTALANDPLELLAVDGPTNGQKGDGDAATWLPPSKAYRCAYVARQVAVKYTYGLWMTAAEHDAVARVLATCPQQRLPVGSAVPPAGGSGKAAGATGIGSAGVAGSGSTSGGGGSTSSGTPTGGTSGGTSGAASGGTKPGAGSGASSGAGAGGTVTYANCTAAWAAGAAPLHRVDPGYSSKLDRDGDGIACESKP